MPRDKASKSNSGGSKPYPKSISFSKSQADMMTQALGTMLSVFNSVADSDDPPQTTYSEEEDELEEPETSNTTPSMMSSASSNDALQATLAPLRKTIAKAETMLEKLRPYMREFVETKSQQGMAETAALMVKNEAIVMDTEAQIALITQDWADREHAKKEAEIEAKRAEQTKRAEVTKGKGKSKAPREEEDEELKRLANIMNVPKGELLAKPMPSGSDPELALLDAIRDGNFNDHSTPIKQHDSTNIGSRFPSTRGLPGGFFMSRSQGSPGMLASPKASPIASTSANPFGATPLHMPKDFSPSKVTGTRVAIPRAVEEKKPPKTKKEKGAGAGTRTSHRNKKDVTYKESEDLSDILDD